MFLDKNYMIIGMARSGVASAKALKEKGAKVIAYDAKSKEMIGDIYDAAMPYVDVFQLGIQTPNFEGIDQIVVSPGVPLDLPFFETAKAMQIPVIGEIELAYELAKGTFIGITGTNGKTTTTTLVGEMYKNQKFDTRVVGNIGNPAVLEALTSDENTRFVTELSSFQLESIQRFHNRVGAILNITPDHLNRHKTMENYVAAKMRVFENQTAEDFAVLNYNDATLRALASKVPSQVWYFSVDTAVEQGAFLESNQLVLKTKTERIEVCSTDDLLIFGTHNIENALAAILIAYLGGVSIEAIREALTTFRGVEHRIEWVTLYQNRNFYNDSKATNPDSSICAIRAMKQPTILLAGGMDKGSTFESVFEAFDGKIKAVVVLGETKPLFVETAKAFNYSEIYTVENMEEAVEKAYELSVDGDAILLSPACASWDMYPNFEARGEHFKRCVQRLIEG